MWTAICLGFQCCGCFLVLHPLQRQHFRMNSRRFKCYLIFHFCSEICEQESPQVLVLIQSSVSRFLCSAIKSDKFAWYFLYCHQCRARSWDQGTKGNCADLSVIYTGHACVHHSLGREATFHMLSTELGRTLCKKWKNKTKKQSWHSEWYAYLYGLVNEFVNLGYEF